GAPKGPEPDAAAPPFAIGPGWRYDKRPSDVHMFICEQDSCNRSSRVSYRLYARDDSITLERFRREQASVVKALEQRAPPGTRIPIVSIEGDGGAKLPRMYKAKRLITAPNGDKEYVISSLLLGQGAAASLISSSLDEKAADANHAVFAIGTMLLVNLPP